MPFIPNAESDREEMLQAIGKRSVEELFSDVPARRRFPKLKLPRALSEQEVLREIGAMATKNRGADKVSWFLGAGIYNHFIPALVPALASRGEFLTAYTPYQPEVSQGTLQAIFEYQSMAARLFGVSVVNASHYDGATALAEAALMAWKLDEERDKILLPEDLHPEYKAVLETYFSSFDVEIAGYRGAPEDAGVDGRCACGSMTPSGRLNPKSAPSPPRPCSRCFWGWLVCAAPYPPCESAPPHRVGASCGG